MDAATAAKLIRSFDSHRGFAQVFLIVAIILISKDLGGLEVLCIVFVSVGIFHRNIDRRYPLINGYGVGHRINKHMRHPLLKTHRRVLLNSTPSTLAYNWRNRLIFAVCVGITRLFGEHIGITNKNVLSALSYFALVYPCVIIAEMYLWFVVERHLQWYLDEARLYKLLQGIWPRTKISELAAELQKMNLIMENKEYN